MLGVVAGSRWSDDGDLLDGIEELAYRAAAESADSAVSIDDELFAFGTAISSDNELELAVGSKLDEASSLIHDHGADLDKLANGAHQLADALAMVRGQVNGAVGSVSSLVTALSAMQAAMGGDKTLNQIDQTAKLVGRMRALGDALNANMIDASNTAAWMIAAWLGK